ncbi:MAG: hypothetical protein RO257_10215 [Candidatus Kapabacteria bacterium]|nr:hypothetical protein [Candidatus Kapabacteria bacterium]
MKLLLAFSVLIITSVLLTAQPATITYQGKLLDNADVPVNQLGASLSFAIYDASSGGNKLWPLGSSAVNKTVDINIGLYSVLLGTGIGGDEAFTAAMFNGKIPYLQVTVGASVLPRTPLTNVPFSLIANQLSASGWASPAAIGSTTSSTGKFTAVAIFNPAAGTIALNTNSTNASNNATVGNFSQSGLGNGITIQMSNGANSARGIDVTQSGAGPGVFATSTGGMGIWGISSTISGAGVLGDNTFGEAVVGRNRGGNGVGAVVGRNDSSGYGVRGFNTKNGIGVLGQSGISGGTGTAGKFENTNAGNSTNVVQVATNGTGAGLTVQLTNAANGARGIDVTQSGVGSGVFATSAGGMALWGIASAMSGAGVLGDNTFGEAVVGRNRGGNGVGAVVGRNDSSGYGVRGFNTKTGIGVLGQSGISGGTGIAGRFENVNSSNNSTTVEVATNGTGRGITVQMTNVANGSRGIDVTHSGSGSGVFATSTGGMGIWGISSTISGAGILGDNTFGEAVVGRNRGGNGVGAVVGRNDSSGYGVRGFNTKNGIGVLGQSGYSGGTGTAGRFENVNSANGSDAFQVASNGTGWSARITNSSASGEGLLISTLAGRVALSVVGGTKNAIVNTSKGPTGLYCEESSEVWFTDYGIGKLTNGSVRIIIDPLYSETVNLNEIYHVFIQARGNAELYTCDYDNTGFSVKSSRGDENVEFSYKIIAKRTGFEDKRMELYEFLKNDEAFISQSAQKPAANIPTNNIKLASDLQKSENFINTSKTEVNNISNPLNLSSESTLDVNSIKNPVDGLNSTSVSEKRNLQLPSESILNEESPDKK